MKLPHLRLLFAGFLALQTFNSQADVELDRIVAVVENDIIMQSELETKLRTVVAQMKQQGVQLPPSNVLETQVLERMILMKIQIQKAEETGIRVDDETLNRTINNIAAGNNVSLSQFKEILEKDGFNYEQFRENIREEIITDRNHKLCIEKEITDNKIDILIDLECDTKLILHWGLCRHSGGTWLLPPSGSWPAGSEIFGSNALQTPFFSSKGKEKIHLRLDRSLHFRSIMFSLFSPDEGRWDNHQGKKL